MCRSPDNVQDRVGDAEGARTLLEMRLILL